MNNVSIRHQQQARVFLGIGLQVPHSPPLLSIDTLEGCESWFAAPVGAIWRCGSQLPALGRVERANWRPLFIFCMSLPLMWVANYFRFLVHFHVTRLRTGFAQAIDKSTSGPRAGFVVQRCQSQIIISSSWQDAQI